MDTLHMINRIVVKMLPGMVGLFVLGLLVRFVLNLWISNGGASLPQGTLQFFSAIFSVVELLNSLLFAGLVLIAIQWFQDRPHTTVRTEAS